MSLHDAFEHAGKAGFAARNEKANCELSAAISFASSRDIIIRTRPRLFPRHADFKIPNTSRISYIILLRQARSLCIIIILLYFDVCHNEAPRRKARETFWLRELWRKFLMRFCSRCGPTKRAFSTSSGNGKQAEGSTKNYRETERSLWLKLIKTFMRCFHLRVSAKGEIKSFPAKRQSAKSLQSATFNPSQTKENAMLTKREEEKLRTTLEIFNSCVRFLTRVEMVEVSASWVLRRRAISILCLNFFVRYAIMCRFIIYRLDSLGSFIMFITHQNFGYSHEASQLYWG